MKNFKDMLHKYAKLAVDIGVNIQKNQTLVINSPIECAEFTRLMAESAYKSGAKNVEVMWHDESLALIKYLNAPEESFKEFPEWQIKRLNDLVEKNAAFISIAASNPDLLKEADPNKIAISNKTKSTALKDYSNHIMKNDVAWCVISVPTKAWSKKVFSNSDENEAVEKLWNNIFKIVRADRDDPIKAWEKHIENNDKKVDFLNNHRFKNLHYKSKDTDLTIELPKDHIWCGCGEYNKAGTYFVANIPTEEVFTLPLKNGVNGKVKSTKPLNFNGNLINDFTLTFKDGKVIDFSCSEGYESLKKLLQMDEGSSYLGEVALVPFDSPISNSNIIFYNTLFDENASCHLAFGKAYSSCLKNNDKLTLEETKKLGANDSLVHVDFMVGSPDLDIIGETHSGEKIQVFKNGNWAF
ncbi:aminopeptidase [Clostridium oceanicum]|uniref:Aminopeptidase n=1 Tax=Clostridium oceanicum TaxID=1543 RepID=A0ABN1JUD5_9CLOT